MTDPIADLLTRIRNVSNNPYTEQVAVPYSTLKEEILKLLAKEDYIKGFTKAKDLKGFDILVVDLNPDKKFNTSYKRISKPGQRIHVKAKNIKPVKNGLGLSIISTSQGLKTDKEAYLGKLGGEVLLEIW